MWRAAAPRTAFFTVLPSPGRRSLQPCKLRRATVRGWHSLLTATGDAGDQGTCVTVVEVGLGEACSAAATCKGPYYCQAGRCTKLDTASCLLADAGK